MEQGKMLYCENCHAPIPEHSAKCPYCGALNASGGEKKYMEQLYDLKEDVRELSSVPAMEYRREMGKIGRTIRGTFLLFAIIAVISGIVFFYNEKYGGFERQEEELKAQMLWQRENFPKLDALYEKGDYDGILEFEYESNESGYYSLSDWKHYDFLNMYRWYRSCKEGAAKAASGDYDADDICWCIIDAMFLIQERSYVSYTGEEEELIDGYRREVRNLLCTEFGMQEEEIDSLYEECCITDKYGTYFDYDTAKKRIKKYVKNNMK